MFEVTSAKLSVASKLLFSDLNISVGNNESVGIVAKSGRGKTSLFRAIMGESQFSLEGGISIQSERYGYCPQRSGLLPWLTLSEHLILYNIKDFIDSLQELEIDHLLNVPARNFSGGEYQRVAIFLSVALCDEMLILDEPFTALDVLTQERTKGWLLRQRQANNFALLVASHNLDLVYEICTSIYVINPTMTRKLDIESHMDVSSLREAILASLQ